MAGRLPPDEDPAFLSRMRQLRKAPRAGDVVERQRRDAHAERDEGPLEQDLERFSGVTRACPECGKDVFDDSAVCYHCGHAFERTAPGTSRMPRWVLVTVALVIAAFVLAVVLPLIW